MEEESERECEVCSDICFDLDENEELFCENCGNYV